MRILVVEDEKDLNNVLCKGLINNNYNVDYAYNGADALELLYASAYDLIITDVMMPKMDGFSLVKIIREKKIETPVIFLTAKDEIDDKVYGLDIGASDYMIKPFIFDELLARIRVITRKNNNTHSNILSISNLFLNIKTFEVTRGDKNIQLTSKEFLLLKHMLINKNIVLSRESLENAILSYEYDGASNMIDVYIRYLRKKIDDDFPNKLIHTIRGSGYVLKDLEVTNE